MHSIARYDRRVVLKLVAVLLAFTAPASALAQQYRWLDEKGGVHYTDTPPPPSARNAQKKNLKGNAVGQQQSYDLSQAMKASPVKLYSHPDCKDPCQLARDLLNRRGVPFTEISAADADKLEELRRVSGGTSVPVLVVGSQVETSPSAAAYNQALDLAGYPAPGVVPPRKQAAPEPARPPAETPAAAR
jgi:glutaredoxin